MRDSCTIQAELFRFHFGPSCKNLLCFFEKQDIRVLIETRGSILFDTVYAGQKDAIKINQDFILLLLHFLLNLSNYVKSMRQKKILNQTQSVVKQIEATDPNPGSDNLGH
jgi:hypothetical protein